jgi:hypothetical protein
MEPKGKAQIIDEYWVEFLEFIRRYNKFITDGDFRFGKYEKDASEINFWHWYIEVKMTSSLGMP